MSQLKRNILANFAGSGWMILLNLAFVPVYLRLMGIEAYGLVGVFAILQAALNLLDMGLSPTINREMARYLTRPEKSQEARDLVRTLEVGYWGVAVLIGGAVITLAPLVARHWVQADQLSPETVQQAVTIMGVVAACQWPLSFYTGGMQGLHKQVLLNGINAGMATMRFGGAAVVLWLVSPTITAFFVWQIFTSAVHTSLVTFVFWRCLPAAPRPPRIQATLLRMIGRFAGGMSAITVTTFILTQLDKIILSKLLPLEKFGYYALASVVTGGLTMLINPIFTAFFPTFSSLVAKGDDATLQQLYHRGCQLISVTILPAAVVIAFFSHEILLLWTGNSATADNTYLIVSLLITGTALNGLTYLPHGLQLAHGWTTLAFYTNAVAILILAPLLIVLVPRYGAVGAAGVWVALNSGYVLIQIQLMHRRLLRGEQWRWYLDDLGLPLVAVLMVAGVARWLLPVTERASMITFAWIVVIYALTLLVAVVVTPSTKGWIKQAMLGKAFSVSQPSGG